MTTLKKKELLIKEFINSFCELSKANRLTGIWDNRRYQEAKKPFNKIDFEYFYKTEKLGRKNVELRAVHRTKLDECFEQLIKCTIT